MDVLLRRVKLASGLRKELIRLIKVPKNKNSILWQRKQKLSKRSQLKTVSGTVLINFVAI